MGDRAGTPLTSTQERSVRLRFVRPELLHPSSSFSIYVPRHRQEKMADFVQTNTNQTVGALLIGTWCVQLVLPPRASERTNTASAARVGGLTGRKSSRVNSMLYAVEILQMWRWFSENEGTRGKLRSQDNSVGKCSLLTQLARSVSRVSRRARVARAQGR